MERNTTIRELFSEAFGLIPEEMEIDKPYLVEEANIGILSFDLETKEKVYKKVLHAIKKEKAPRLEFILSNNQKLICSYDHRFAISTPKKNIIWINAIALKDKDLEDYSLISESGENIQILEIKDIPEDYILDIEVEDTFCYFSEGILSHNSLYGADTKTTGGYAPKYYSSWRGRITRIDYIKEKGIQVGIISKVRTKKSKIGIPGREAELHMRFDTGFDTKMEYISFLTDLGIVEQKGAWFYQEEWGFKGNGKKSIVEFLDENPDIFEQAKNTINAILMGATILDEEDTENPSEITEDSN